MSKTKKKRSFMQNMKKMHKKGLQRGRQLPNEIYTYYFTLYEDFRKAEKQEKDILIQRVLQDLVKENRIKDLAKNQLGSRMLEEMLRDAPTKYLFPVIDAFSEDLRVIFVDEFSSFVLQTLIKISFKNIQEGAMEKMENLENNDKTPVLIDETSKSSFIEFLLKVSKFTYNNLEDFITDKYSSHIVRAVLEVCSGVEIPTSANNKTNTKSISSHSLNENELKVVEVPKSLTSVWHEILERIQQLPNFEDLIVWDCVSATLQIALLTSEARKETEIITSLSSHIMEHGVMKLGSVNSNVHPVFDNHPTCRLMEALVSVVPKKNQELIYNAFFRDQIMTLVNHGIAWHAVDKLFASLKSKKLFASVVENHSNYFKEAFLHNKGKILQSVVRSCRRLNTCQDEVVKMLIEMCKCNEPKENEHRFVGPLLHMVTLEEYEMKKESDNLLISSFGSYILQDMLHFHKTKAVANSISQMSNSELFKMAQDPKASHVIDCFFTSPFVKQNLKEELYKKLKGKYVALAHNSFGTYIVEHIFNFLNINLKSELCEELYQSSNQLQASPCGFIIYNKFHLQYFTVNGGRTWRERIEKLSAKRSFLSSMQEEIDKSEMQEKQPPLKKQKT